MERIFVNVPRNSGFRMKQVTWKVLIVVATMTLSAVHASSTCTLSPKLDVAVIYDGSESMAREPSLSLIKKYIHRIVEMLDVQADPSKGARIGIWGYTFTPHIQIDFSSCRTQEHALRVVERIRELGSAGVVVSDMFSYVAESIFKPSFGARSSDPTVTKVAIVLLDSPILISTKPAAQIRASLQAAKIETYAVVIEDNGLKAATINPYLPSPHSPAFQVLTKAGLASFKGLHDALEKRYGCKKCSPNPCKNGGKCTEITSSSSYQCQCVGAWKGKDCSTQNPCNLCITNGGLSCTLSTAGTFASCTCPTGKIGNYCHLPDPCLPTSPCKNSASCTPDPSTLNSYTCKCLGNFSGKNCTDPIKPGPCASSPCNGYPCNEEKSGGHSCTCPAYCSNPSDCSGCVKSSPCATNPCQNNCICQVSTSHEGGFVCHSPSGHLGRLCNIPKADITCGPTYIEVKVPQELVKEYEGGTPGAVAYLSPTTENSYNCLAILDPSQKKYVFRYPAPFTQCGTVKKPVAGGSEFENKMWLNRVSATFDMPVPVVRFKCVYSDSQTVVSTSLRPALRGDAPIITSVGAFNVSLEAFKRAPDKPDNERGKLTSGSVYIVGEQVFLTATLRSRPSTPSAASLVVKLVDCYATPAPNSLASKVDLVKNGCPVPAMEVKIHDNAVGPSATVGFRTFKLGSGQYIFYSCRVDVCNKNEPTCTAAKNCAAGRRKRAVDGPRNTLSTGPIIVLTDEEQERLKQLLGSREHVYIAQELLDPKEDMDPDDAISRNQELVIITAANFFGLAVLCVIFLCMYIRQQSQK